MGAWGTGSFQNDDARDWISEIEGFDGLSVVRAKLKEVATSEGSVHAPDCFRAIAAAEVVAAISGQPCSAPPEAIEKMVAVQVTILQADRDLAREALDRVLGEQSELAQLWADSPKIDAWRASVAELRSRLT